MLPVLRYGQWQAYASAWLCTRSVRLHAAIPQAVAPAPQTMCWLPCTSMVTRLLTHWAEWLDPTQAWSISRQACPVLVFGWLGLLAAAATAASIASQVQGQLKRV